VAVSIALRRVRDEPLGEPPVERALIAVVMMIKEVRGDGVS
jgi:hypothetical protein